MVAISANERVQREKDNTVIEKERADNAEAELATMRSENAARANQQSVTSRITLENPDQEDRPDPTVFGMFDGRKLTLPPEIIEELENRNAHYEFQIDDKAGSLNAYIRPGSPWEIYRDALGKEVRVPASPADASQELVLIIVDKKFYNASIDYVTTQQRERMEGTLRLRPNEYVGDESTIFNKN